MQEGDNAGGILLSSLRTPADFNDDMYSGVYTDPAGQVFPDAHVCYRNPLSKDLSTIFANPNWNINNNVNTSDVDGLIGSVQFDITPIIAELEYESTESLVDAQESNQNKSFISKTLSIIQALFSLSFKL